MGETTEHLHCPRCDAERRVIQPWRGWKPAWLAWKVGVVGVLALTPLLASDFCVMLPSMMLYLASGGILRGLARQLPVCSRCSLEIDGAPRPAPAVA